MKLQPGPGLAPLILLVLGGCDSNAISFTATGPPCTVDFGDASDNCPPSACPFIGAWQNVGLVGGAPRCAEGAVAFDGAGGISQLTSSGWEDAGRYATCANWVRGARFRDLFGSRVPANCDPACEARFDRTPDAGSSCVLNIDITCSPSPANGNIRGLSVFYYPCSF